LDRQKRFISDKLPVHIAAEDERVVSHEESKKRLLSIGDVGSVN
jgi:hypothetical protein